MVAKDTSSSRRVDYLGWYLSLRDCLCCPLLYSEEPFKAYGTRFLLSGTVEGRGSGIKRTAFPEHRVSRKVRVTIEAQAVTGKVETGTAQERGAMEAKIRYRRMTSRLRGRYYERAQGRASEPG